MSAEDTWRKEAMGLAWDFAKLTADLDLKRPQEAGEPTLKVIGEGLAVFLSDYFSREEVASALQSAEFELQRLAQPEQN